MEKLKDIVKKKQLELVDYSFPEDDITKLERKIDKLSNGGLDMLHIFEKAVICSNELTDIQFLRSNRDKRTKLSNLILNMVDADPRKSGKLIGDDLELLDEIAGDIVDAGIYVGIETCLRSVSDYAKEKLYPNLDPILRKNI